MPLCMQAKRPIRAGVALRSQSRTAAAHRPRPLVISLAAAWIISAPCGLLAQPAPPAAALPSGPQVVNGQVQILTRGSQMTVTSTPGAILNWRSFSIGESAAVHFQQADEGSKVLNRVTGQDPSSIFGSLTSNGQVWLLNPNGVLFGQGARIDVAGIVASTLRLNDGDFLNRHLRLLGDGAGAQVRNDGRITTAWGGQVVLLGERVANAGEISAPGGSVTLAAARSAELVDTGLPHLAVRVDAASGEVLNLGRVLADGGRIDIFGGAVNQQGLVRADTLATDAQGRIVLKAGDTLTLGAGSLTQAAGSGLGLRGGAVDLLGPRIALLGDAAADVSGTSGGGSLRVGGGLRGQDPEVSNAQALWFGPQASLRADATGRLGDGGRIVLWSDHATRAYGSLSARGGSAGGDGGFVETSGGWLDARPARVDVSSRAGRAGQWLLDPNDIFIINPGSVGDLNITGGPVFTSTADSSILTTTTIAAALNAGTSVTVQTGSAGANAQAGDIVMDLASISVVPPSPVSLTLSAFRDVVVNNSLITSSGAPLSLNLVAGAGPVGAIGILGSSISTAGGDVVLRGAQSRQMPQPDGTLTPSTFQAAVGYDPFAAALPSRLQNARHGVSLVDTSIDTGAGSILATGLAAASTSPEAGVYLGISDGATSLSGARIELRGWSAGSGGIGVWGEQVQMTSTGPMLLSGAGRGVGVLLSTTDLAVSAAAGSGASLTVLGSAGLLGDGVRFQSGSMVVANSAVQIEGSTIAPVSEVSTYGIDISGSSLDFTAAGTVQLTGTAANVGLRIDASDFLGPTSSALPLQLSSVGGALELSSSIFQGAGNWAVSGSSVRVLASDITAAGGPLSLAFDTTGSNPRGLALSDVSVTTGGGDVVFGQAQLLPGTTAVRNWVRNSGTSTTPALSLEGVTLAAGSGAVRGGGAHLSPGSAGKGTDLGGVTLTAGSIDLAGRGASGGGTGLDLRGANLEAAQITLSGTGGGDAFGVDTSTSPAGLLRFTDLTVTGSSPGGSPLHAGVRLGGGIILQGANRGSVQISADSVMLGDVAALGTLSLSGDLASVQVRSSGSMALANAQLDFSAGAGTGVSLVADSDGNQAGRVLLQRVTVNTGGGDFSASGVGASVRDAAGDPLPINLSVSEGVEGIRLNDSIDIVAGVGNVALTGRAAPGVGAGFAEGTGILVAGPVSLAGNAVTLDGRAPVSGVGIDANFTPLDAFLSVTAGSISLFGQGAGTYSPGQPNPGIGLVSGSFTSGGDISLNSTGPLAVSGYSMTAGAGLTMTAFGDGGATAASRLSFSTLSSAGAMSISGQSTDGGAGLSMGSGMALTAAALSLSGSGGLRLDDAVGSTFVTATAGPITLTGSGAAAESSLSVRGNWIFDTPGEISLATDNAPTLAPGLSSLQAPSFTAGGAFSLSVVNPPGALTLGTGPFPVLDAASLASALFDHTGPVNLRVTGSSSTIAVDAGFSVTGRLTVQADNITLRPGSQLQSLSPLDAIVLRGATQEGAVSFDNAAGVAALSTPVGRWVVIVDSPSAFTAGGLVPAMTQYGLGADPWTQDGAGNYITPLQSNALGYVRSMESVAGAPLAARLSKTYDATTAIALDPATWAVTGLVPGDQLLLSGAPAASLVDRNAGPSRPVNVSTGTVFRIIDSNGNPVFGFPSPVVTADVARAPLAASGTVAAGKVYDGNTDATFLSVGTVTPLASDVVTLVAGTGAFADRNVGTAKTVTASGFTLSGADAANYVLQPLAPVQADITARPVAVTGLAALDKVYDATASAAVSGAALPAGAVVGDALSVSGTPLGAFADRNVGTAKPVTVTGLGLAGADAGNYTLLPTVLAAGIAPAALTYTATPAAGVAGLPLPPLGGTVVGLLGSDTLATATTGTLSWSTSATPSSLPGQYGITGGGLAALNYTFAQAAGNATALTLDVPVLVDPATPVTATALDYALDTVQPRVLMSTPVERRVLDATPAMGVGGAFAAPSTALSVQPGGRARILQPQTEARARIAASFAAVDWARLPREEAQNLLAARGKYKHNLFEPAFRLLQADPAQADLSDCRDLDQANSGDCIVSDDLKRRARAAAQMRDPSQGQRRVLRAALPRISRKQALLIGVNAYEDRRIPELTGAVNDARVLRELFEQRLGYETTLVENPTRQSIVRAFNRLVLDSDPEDSVAVYFAGHGVLVPLKGVETGFWLPADSSADRPQTWLSNNDIARLLALLGSRQTLVISDSCYSGAMVGRDRSGVSGAGSADELLSRRAALVMSSGGEEPVADEGKDGHSVFAWHLMQSLRGLQQWQPGGNLFERVRAGVASEFPQTPQYGASRTIGHQGNTDYLFERREIEAPKP